MAPMALADAAGVTDPLIVGLVGALVGGGITATVTALQLWFQLRRDREQRLHEQEMAIAARIQDARRDFYSSIAVDLTCAVEEIREGHAEGHEKLASLQQRVAVFSSASVVHAFMNLYGHLDLLAKGKDVPEKQLSEAAGAFHNAMRGDLGLDPLPEVSVTISLPDEESESS